jgi:SAM-dependent methyltransferase
VPSASDPDPVESLLAEQVDYYRAMATEYEDHALRDAGGEELEAALETFRPAGDVLELASGTGLWTKELLRYADSVTCVDAAPEMLAVAKQRLDDSRVRFLQGNLFEWRPDRRYDVVFFGFWLSHVPAERFDSFWSLVADCLAPGGRVFFVDDGHRTPEELVEGENSVRIQRRLNDGAAFEIVKVPLRPAELQSRLSELGWRIEVHETAGPFFWGQGTAQPV